MRAGFGARRGSVIPLVAVGMVGLCGFAALAVDIGMIAIARSQCQNAADAAALSAARALSGSTTVDLAAATAAGKGVAQSNLILGTAIEAGEVSIVHGAYHYDETTQSFSPQYPPTPPESYNLSRATIARQVNTAFARVLGIATADVAASATAAHRPRDVAVIVDFSGSMNNESDLWNNESYLGSANDSPNNKDSVFPRFGHYSSVSSAKLQATGTDSRVGKCNVTQAALGIPALVDDFHQHDRGDASVAAFMPAPTTYDLAPAGDRPLFKHNSTSTYAANLSELTSGAVFKGYTHPPYSTYTGSATIPEFSGYTQGPRYWGKTFFIWPPDPRAGNDWRAKFFGTNDNTDLWDGSGNWRNPAGYYTINYAAILAWIKAEPCPFPSQLRAGRILYYDAIPDDVPSSVYDHTVSNATITNQNQRFWKEYIDYTIGVWRDPFNAIQVPGKPACSIAPDFNWGTVKINSPPTSGSPVPYMNTADNPKRPRHRFWFGPMTMVQFVSDTRLLPGNAHDISTYSAKLGIAGALQNAKINHPNDMLAFIPFSRPVFSTDPSNVGQFPQAQFNLSRNYDGMIDSLWFPPNSSMYDVRPWDSDGLQTPRVYGDFTSNTTTRHGFMLAYNQFTGNTVVRTAGAGGLGRKGAQRLVILETDGMANYNSIPNLGFVNAGDGQSYYPILPGQNVKGGGYSESDLLKTVQAICNKGDGSPGNGLPYSPNPNYPGFATARKPVVIHTLAFGPIFEPNASGGEQTNAVALLRKISEMGGTRFPESASDATDGYKWIIGSIDERKDKLKQAFTRVMDDGISVTLVE